MLIQQRSTRAAIVHFLSRARSFRREPKEFAAVASKLGLDADALMASLPPYEEASRRLDELMH